MTTEKTKAHQLLSHDPASKLLGISIDTLEHKASDALCEVSMLVRDDMTNGYDVCHGGFIFTLADTALAFVCAEADKTIVSASAQIEFLKPAKLNDRLIAQATIRQRAGRQWFCDITVRNQRGDCVALMNGRQVQLHLKD